MSGSPASFGAAFCLVFDLYMILCGVAGLIRGKLYGALARSAGQYTEESLAQFVRPYSLCQLGFGLGMAILLGPTVLLGVKDLVWIILGGVLALASAVGMLLAQKKILKKRC